MNKQLEMFARQKLKEGLAMLPETWHLFRQMYSYPNLEMPINEVVDNMAAEKLDWAMQQVENTLKKKAAKPQEDKD